MPTVIASLIAGLTPQQLDLLEDENHDTEVYICAIVFSILAILAATVRVISRHSKHVAIGIDDVLIILAMSITLVQTTYICVGVQKYGLGRHLWTLSKEQLVGFNKLWYTSGFLQCTALFLTKISVLMLFHRIFITPAFQLATKVIGAVMALWWIGSILARTFICIPIEYNWNPKVSGHCGNKELLVIIPPIPWIVTDFLILIMPLPMVWKLHLPRLQRVGVGMLFLLGGFAIVSSCVRYSTLFFRYDDLTYYVIPATVWTIIESNVTIISACLIVSRPWFVKIYPSRLINLIQERTRFIRKSLRISEKHASSAESRQDKWQLFSSFKRLPETPPADTSVSLGMPFELDVEKGNDSERSGHANA